MSYILMQTFPLVWNTIVTAVKTLEYTLQLLLHENIHTPQFIWFETKAGNSSLAS